MSKPIPWQIVPKAQRILARTNPADLTVCEDRGALPADRLYLAGDAACDLTKVRRDFMAIRLGGTFLELEAAGRLDDWRRADADLATVQDVLAERFGSPMQFAGYSLAEAEQRWRIAATARIAQDVAA